MNGEDWVQVGGTFVLDNLSGIFERELQSAVKAAKDRSDAAWVEFNEELEKYNNRQLAKEREFWRKHELIRAEQLHEGSVIVEKRGRKTNQLQVRSIVRFGRFDRHLRVQVYGANTMFSYHVCDEVLVRR